MPNQDLEALYPELTRSGRLADALQSSLEVLGAQLKVQDPLGAAYATPIFLAATGRHSAWILMPIATAPLAFSLMNVVLRKGDGPSLNRALARTAQLLLLFAVLLSIGIAV